MVYLTLLSALATMIAACRALHWFEYPTPAPYTLGGAGGGGERGDVCLYRGHRVVRM